MKISKTKAAERRAMSNYPKIRTVFAKRLIDGSKATCKAWK